MKIYVYTIRYRFSNRKFSEEGYGTIYNYRTFTPLEETTLDVFKQIEKEIAFERKHDSVEISCFDPTGIMILS